MDRLRKQEYAGLGETHFIAKSQHDTKRDGPIFLFARYMRERPTSLEEIEKKPDIFHVVLTGWKGQYNLKHPRYFKIGYSSHSSPDELTAMVSGVSPAKLVMNLPERKGEKVDQCRVDFQLGLFTKYTQQGKAYLKNPV